MVVNVDRHHDEVGFTIARNSPECRTLYDGHNLLLPILCVVDVDRAYPHVWAESIFVEYDSAASIVGHVDTFCEGFVQQLPVEQ